MWCDPCTTIHDEAHIAFEVRIAGEKQLIGLHTAGLSDGNDSRHIPKKDFSGYGQAVPRDGSVHVQGEKSAST